MNHERRACKAAVIQALFYHFHQRNKDICELLQVDPATVSGVTVSSTKDVIPWHERRHHQLAILRAQMVLQMKVLPS